MCPLGGSGVITRVLERLKREGEAVTVMTSEKDLTCSAGTGNGGRAVSQETPAASRGWKRRRSGLSPGASRKNSPADTPAPAC